jgi:8-oxo-dGTP diphosphatase
MTIKLAGCIINDSQNNILLLHRNTAARQHWEIPGGKLETDEDAASSAVREVKEELGITVKIEKLLGGREFTEDDIKMHYTWYKAKIVSGQPKVMEPEIFDGMRYFSADEMHDIVLSTGAQTFLAMLEKGLITVI